MTDDYNTLQDIVLFVEVARARSFTRSAALLGLSPATVSRRIASLEQQAGARLFNRTTRRVELTSLGSRFLERCGHLVDEAALAHKALRSEASLPTGHLRISMPVDFGVSIIGPMLPAFARRYRGISFDIDLSPHFRDLLGDQADVALRLGTARDKILKNC
jgi:DNA-binding transcriptional LysR family regulator